MKLRLSDLKRLIKETIDEESLFETEAPPLPRHQVKPGLTFKLCHARYKIIAITDREIKTERLSDNTHISWEPSEFYAQLENMHPIED